MSATFAQLTISLDGFGAGVDDGADHPLGVGGLDLHRWILDPGKTEVDRQVAAEMMTDAGVFVIGRRMADIGIPIWGDEGAFGRPVFVVTHRPHPVVVKGPTTFTFVTDGLIAALDQARAAAGNGGVCFAGGPTLIRQALAAGVIDTLRLSIAPLLLRRGVPLFNGGMAPGRYTPDRVSASPFATHIHYRIDR